MVDTADTSAKTTTPLPSDSGTPGGTPKTTDTQNAPQDTGEPFTGDTDNDVDDTGFKSPGTNWAARLAQESGGVSCGGDGCANAALPTSAPLALLALGLLMRRRLNVT